jgi:hypothetical protein
MELLGSCVMLEARLLKEPKMAPAIAAGLGEFMGATHTSTHVSQVSFAQAADYFVQFKNESLRGLQLEYVRAKRAQRRRPSAAPPKPRRHQCERALGAACEGFTGGGSPPDSPFACPFACPLPVRKDTPSLRSLETERGKEDARLRSAADVGQHPPRACQLAPAKKILLPRAPSSPR